MRVLGIDCGLKTGWAVVENGKVLESGTEDFNPRRGSSYGTLFMEYRRWLSQMIQPMRPGETRCYDLIVYEQSHMRGGAATELQINMSGRVQEIAAAMKIEYIAVRSSTLKKYFTGKGNASKEEMMAKAEQFIGRAPEDDNEADGVALAMNGYDKLKGGEEMLSDEPDVPEGEVGSDTAKDLV